MMSSVIPARLQFQCGHAALVTLPRIKGETAAQRNDRVAREKSAALARQCDFCAPAVVEFAMHGNHHASAETAEPEPVVAISQPETELVVIADAQPEPDVLVLVAEDSLQEVESILATEPVVKQATAAIEEIIAAELPVNGSAPVPVRVPRRRATQPAAKVRAEAVARGRRFLVEYRVERVLRAVDIHDALRQATTFGADQLTAITRED
jgi:hypothetical protein